MQFRSGLLVGTQDFRNQPVLWRYHSECFLTFIGMQLIVFAGFPDAAALDVEESKARSKLQARIWSIDAGIGDLYRSTTCRHVGTTIIRLIRCLGENGLLVRYMSLDKFSLG